ncbi:hypothetical protein [Psychromonas antarctica]|nr:hypothetical protein [Psychromonas antarctica]
MSQINNSRIPSIPHSIDGAAKVLKTDKDNIITWLLDGELTAA